MKELKKFAIIFIIYGTLLLAATVFLAGNIMALTCFVTAWLLIFYLHLSKFNKHELAINDCPSTHSKKEVIPKNLNDEQIEKTFNVFNEHIISQLSKDGYILIDKDGFILNVNKQVESYFGYCKADIITSHLSLFLFFTEPTHQKTTNTMIERIKKIESKPERLYFLNQVGSYIPIEMSINKLPQKNTTLYHALIRDITSEQEQLQREIDLYIKLFNKELIYKSAFNKAAIGIARVSVDSYIVEVNPMLCEIFGYNEKELCKLSLKDLIVDTDIEKSEMLIRQLLNKELESFNADNQYVRKDESKFLANTSVSLVCDNVTNRPIYMIAVIEDISDRKNIETAIINISKEREELLAGLTIASEAGGVNNWSLDLVTNKLKWDEGTRLLYGIDLDQQLVYQDWLNIVYPDDVIEIKHHILAAIHNMCSFKIEFRVFNVETNELVWVQCAANVSCNEDNTPTMMFGINIDITHEKLIQIELEKETLAAKHANEAKSRLLATMSHEIRTPMNGVIGMIDLLRQTHLDTEQKRMTATIKDSSFSLLDIINDILDFSKIESGQIELELTSVSILSLIERTVDTLCINANKKNIQLYICPDLKIPDKVKIDAVRFRQIILNLVGNAIKFSSLERKGVVILKTRFDWMSTSLVVDVIDNGIGISELQQEKLFTPFIQADTSTTRKFGGTGLGLSICKSFSELMGGEIKLTSQLGKGSCFRLSIPITKNKNAKSEFEHLDFSEYRFYIVHESKELSQCCQDIIAQLNPLHVGHIEIDKLENLCAIKDEQVVVITSAADKNNILESTSLKTLILNPHQINNNAYIDPLTYVVKCVPLKPSELIHGLAVLCELESPTLDLNDEIEEAHRVELPLKVHKKQNHKLILVAEDQPTNRLVLSNQLESLGYEHEIAVDGNAAYKLWKTGRFSLLLTDCHMPNMDGFALTKKIRKEESRKGLSPTTIIAVTANALVGEFENCIRAGMNDYIAKPVELKMLKIALSKYMSRDKNTQALGEVVDCAERNKANDSIDFKHLIKIIGTNDKTITDEILLMYWNSVTQDTKKLVEAVEEGQSDLIRTRAHALKGISFSTGAAVIGETFKWIEKNASNIEDIKQKLHTIESEILRIKDLLVKRGILQIKDS
ncbi:PAS domain S-box protein [Shewanella sp. UCD-KL21]|uniref:PAS domain S-box protein n=1 Tax=Shewanella sp. UCD-KL21 TaxID=1917164 RepID=UPI00097081D2|nr:PAS domain S-box protein [Shewanella sp. UCD-KL21]